MRWHAAGDLRLDEVELALPLGPGMVEAEVAFTGICGSDVAEFKAPFAIRPGRAHPLTAQQPPVTLGHEFSAVVTAVGEGVDQVAPGDRVSADACWRCNECEACVSGRYNLCRLSGSIGLSSDGAFAPLVRFPAYCAVPLPDEVGDEVGALLEPLAVGLHALDRGGARGGERLVVIGYGPIGACTALVGRALGLEALVLETHPGRRARAEAEGFATYDPGGGTREVAREVRGLVGGGNAAGAEIVVDCIGRRAGSGSGAGDDHPWRPHRHRRHPQEADPGRRGPHGPLRAHPAGDARLRQRPAAGGGDDRLRPAGAGGHDHEANPAGRDPGRDQAPGRDPQRRRQGAGPGRDVSDAATTVVVPMPHMGVSVEEGTVIEWLKEVGDEVVAEEVLCAIATDKVDTEVVAPVDGVLARILVAVDESVAVGAPLAELTAGADAAAVLDAGEAVGAGSADAPSRESDAASEDVGGAPRSVSGDPTPTALAGSGAAGRVAFVSDEGDKGDPSSGDRDGLRVRAAAGRDEFGRFDPVAAAAAVLSFVADRGGSRGHRGGSPSDGAGAARLASPVARRMAARNSVDLGSIQGSGRAGRIRKADVEAAIAGGVSSPARATAPSSSSGAGAVSPVRAPAPGTSLGAADLPVGYENVPHEVVKTSRVRQLIAEHMVRSRQTAAHMTTEVDVDVSAVVRARAELNTARLAAGEAKLSYLPFIARAACVALGDHPELNATFLGERTIHWGAVNLGIAVDTPEGLLVPVVRDCDRLAVPAIGDAIADLAERARGRKLTPDDLVGGTFTLSNPGSVGAVSAPAIINQPQVAILGVPTIQRRPWVIADEHGEESIAIRPILRLAVTFDHRAVDGAGATRFAVAVKDSLESWDPESYT